MKKLNRILYVSETSVHQEPTFARAVSLAENNQAKLDVLEVIPEQFSGNLLPAGGPTALDLINLVKDQAQKGLEQLVKPYQSEINIGIDVIMGTKFLEVIHAVLRNKYDLVIKPSENPDWIDRLFGSDDMHLLRKCPCPVWLTKPDEKHDYDTILAALDFDQNDNDFDEDPLNESIFELASSLAISDSADLHLVHAWDSPEAGFVSMWLDKPELAEIEFSKNAYTRHKSGFDRVVSKLENKIGKDVYDYLSVKTHLPKGPARVTVPALAKEIDADLVIIGTVARTGIPGFIIGNTAESILDQLTCSVIALKPPGFVSPVTLPN